MANSGTCATRGVGMSPVVSGRTKSSRSPHKLSFTGRYPFWVSAFFFYLNRGWRGFCLLYHGECHWANARMAFAMIHTVDFTFSLRFLAQTGKFVLHFYCLNRNLNEDKKINRSCSEVRKKSTV